MERRKQEPFVGMLIVDLHESRVDLLVEHVGTAGVPKPHAVVRDAPLSLLVTKLGGSMRLTLDGHRLSPSSTPRQIGLENGDHLLAFDEQSGGGAAHRMRRRSIAAARLH